jgi:hypothetical protein
LANRDPDSGADGGSFVDAQPGPKSEPDAYSLGGALCLAVSSAQQLSQYLADRDSLLVAEHGPNPVAFPVAEPQPQQCPDEPADWGEPLCSDSYWLLLHS